MKKNKMAGMTLIEVMVAAAIIAILAAIAFPTYQAQVQKTRRTEARTALSNIQLAEERFYTANGSYTNNFTLLGLTAGDYNSIGNSSVITQTEYYNIGISVTNSNTRFVLNAVAQGAQAGDDDCDWLSINHLGVKAADTAVCW